MRYRGKQPWLKKGFERSGPWMLPLCERNSSDNYHLVEVVSHRFFCLWSFSSSSYRDLTTSQADRGGQDMIEAGVDQGLLASHPNGNGALSLDPMASIAMCSWCSKQHETANSMQVKGWPCPSTKCGTGLHKAKVGIERSVFFPQE